MARKNTGKRLLKVEPETSMQQAMARGEIRTWLAKRVGVNGTKMFDIAIKIANGEIKNEIYNKDAGVVEVAVSATQRLDAIKFLMGYIVREIPDTSRHVENFPTSEIDRGNYTQLPEKALLAMLEIVKSAQKALDEAAPASVPVETIALTVREHTPAHAPEPPKPEIPESDKPK